MYGMAVRNAFTKPEEQATVRAEAFEIGVSRWPLLALEIKTLTDTYWVNFAKADLACSQPAPWVAIAAAKYFSAAA